MMKLYIGNKNYSSWSMRSGVLLTAFGIAHEEVLLRLDFSPGSTFAATLQAAGGVAKVPLLVEDDGLAVWETLSIAEYIAERHPEHAIWPRERRARARARSLCAEMHAGFGSLRSLCPMNIEAFLPEVGARLLARETGLQRDLARLDQLWSEALGASDGGPFLFGEFGAVDAYFAPVVMRISRFGLPLSALAAGYAKAVEQHPAVAAWIAGALAEHDFIADDEPYRTAP
ncbi:glutathione S-transferase family protein [soil metagenome]